MKHFFAALSLLVSSSAWAGPDHTHKPGPAPQAFDMLKKMVGTWEGTSKMGGKDTTFTSTYELSSGGSAIIEKIFVGTEHEMVSVYSYRGKKVAMTHYCMLGNQPEMELRDTKPKLVHFEMTKPIGVNSLKDPHMHAVTISWTDDDNFQQEWVNFTNGKRGEIAVFNLKRKPAANPG